MKYCIKASNKCFFFDVEKGCSFVLDVDKSECTKSYLRLFKNVLPSEPTKNYVFAEFDGGAHIQVIDDCIIITVDNIDVALYLEERFIKAGIDVRDKM